jgi:hypothetical protein
MEPIRDLRELAELLSQPRALLFLWVEWSMQASRSRAVVAQALELYEAKHPGSPVPCYTADVGDQSGEVWDLIAVWFAKEVLSADQFLWSGSGPLLWLRYGHIVHHLVSPLQFRAAYLVASSRTVFAPGT